MMVHLYRISNNFKNWAWDSNDNIVILNALYEAFLVHAFCTIDYYAREYKHKLPDDILNFRKSYFNQVINLGNKRTEIEEDKVTHENARKRIYEYITTELIKIKED